MKRLKRWILLSTAGVLAILAGDRTDGAAAFGRSDASGIR